MQLRSGKIIKSVVNIKEKSVKKSTEKNTEKRNEAKLFLQEVKHLLADCNNISPFHTRLRILFQIVMKATKFYQTIQTTSIESLGPNLVAHQRMLRATKDKCEQILYALDIHTDEEIELSGYTKKYMRGQITKTLKMLADKYNL